MIKRSLLASLFLALPALAGVRAHYLVFELDRGDAITLIAAEEVELAEAPRGFATSQPDRVDVELLDGEGRAVYTTAVAVDRAIRAEFASSDGTIEGRRLELDRVPFVVRVPAGGESVQLRTPRSTAAFSVRNLPKTRITRNSAPPANRLDLLIMGDGYTESDAVKFEKDVQRVTTEFFSIEPYRTYRNYVNVTSHFVASPQAGADHPPCGVGSVSYVETAFDASFCSYGIDRLISVNSGKVYAAAAAVPDWDYIIVLVNDSQYGGAGGGLIIASTHEDVVPVVQHELGHSFTRLADEYTAPFPEHGVCSDIAGGWQTCEANVTDQTSRSQIKWNSWIESSTAVPTPDSFSGVGLFLGARYVTTGLYRPKATCLMNVLDAPFCEICTQEYVLRLYDSLGIDIIEAVTPTAGVINQNTPISFDATLLHTTAGAPNVQWLVDGSVVSVAASFVYTPTPGTHIVELRVTDPTMFVRPSMAGDVLTSTRTWTVLSGPTKRRRAVR